MIESQRYIHSLVDNIVQLCEGDHELESACNDQYFWKMSIEKYYWTYSSLFPQFTEQDKWKGLIIYLNSVRNIPVYDKDKNIAGVKFFSFNTLCQLCNLLREISSATFKSRYKAPYGGYDRSAVIIYCRDT